MGDEVEKSAGGTPTNIVWLLALHIRTLELALEDLVTLVNKMVDQIPR